MTDAVLLDASGDQGVYSGPVSLDSNLPHTESGVAGGAVAVGEMQYDDGRFYRGGFQMGRWDSSSGGTSVARFPNGDVYAGEYSLDQRHGYGEYVWSDGRVYRGSFQRDRRHGQGQYTWTDGAVYSGEFDQGQRQGQGEYTYKGGRYKGGFVNGLYEGYGECIWYDDDGNDDDEKVDKVKVTGRSYKGEWKQGKAHGYGTERDENDKILHDGQWENDEAILSKSSSPPPPPTPPPPPPKQQERRDFFSRSKSLSALMMSSSRSLSTGSASKKKLTTTRDDGAAATKRSSVTSSLAQRISAPSSASLNPVVDRSVVDAVGRKGVFRGTVLHGSIPHGVGFMEYREDDWIHSYQGFWEKGYWQEGQVEYKNGDTYNGVFESHSNVRCGKGEYHWADGRQYVGEWNEDCRHGQGTYLYPNGDVFEGQFCNGQRHGTGRFRFHRDGTLMEGNFCQGQLDGSGCKYVQKDGRVYLGHFVRGIRYGQGKETYPNGDLRYEGEWVDDAPLHPNKIHDPPAGFVLKQDDEDDYNDDYTACQNSNDGLEGQDNEKKEEEEEEEDFGTPPRPELSRRESVGSVNSLVQSTRNCKTVVERVIRDAQGNPGTFTGLVLDGLPHGVGRMVYHGEIREGFWRHGYLEGHARAFFSNGDFYEGNFVQSQREGKGVYKWKDGRVYEGKTKRSHCYCVRVCVCCSTFTCLCSCCSCSCCFVVGR